jgi:hypothetical protein
MNPTKNPPLEWTQNTGGRRRLVEAEAIVPIHRDAYLTIGADPDETGAVPEALAALPEVQAALVAQGWRAPVAVDHQPNPVTKSTIYIYNGPSDGVDGRMLVTFNHAFIFYDHWLVTFARWDSGKKTFECTASWLNYAGDGSWDVTGFRPTTARWIPLSVLHEVVQWLRMVPSALLPHIPALLPPPVIHSSLATP